MSQTVDARTIGAYLDTLGSSAPTPGGGSVAGVIGALGCALGIMVIAFTKPKDEEVSAALATVDSRLSDLRLRFTQLAEQDEAAYQGYRDAAKLPKGSPEEQSQRKAQLQTALKHAASVPFETSKSALVLAHSLEPVRRLGNPHLLSDTRIAFLCASTCFEAARINVDVNLGMIHDDEFVSDLKDKLESLADQVQKTLDA